MHRIRRAQQDQWPEDPLALAGDLPNPVVNRGLLTVLTEGLFMPTGLLAVVYLVRRLGPTGYATFALAAAVIVPLQWATTAPFSAAFSQAITVNADGRAAVAVLLRRQLLATMVAAIMLWLIAPAIATLLATPLLGPTLRLFALDIPLFGLGQAHRDILSGLNMRRWRTIGNVGRMLARPLLIVLCVEAGLGVMGAVIGTIGVSIVHLALGRWAAQPVFFSRAKAVCAIPTILRRPADLLTLSLRVFERLDLLMLATLRGGAAAVGTFSAAHFLTTLPGSIALAFMPPLLAAIRTTREVGTGSGVRALERGALRAALLVAPFAVLALFTAPYLLRGLFGDAYGAATLPLRFLIVAASAQIVLVTAATILIATKRPILVIVLASALPLLAIGGHWLLIPRGGATGAAMVTMVVAIAGAVTGTWAVVSGHNRLEQAPNDQRTTD
jgi:O-antigen/teichoic acid export membrane protein